MAHTHVLDLAGVCTGNGPCDVTPNGSGNNWVTRAGGLPLYIRAVSKAFRRKGLPESEAISRAIGVVRNWSQGKGDVTPATRARAVAAMAEWNAMKARAHSLSATSEGLDLAPKGQPPNQTKTKKAKADPNANKAALDAQQAQFLAQTNQGGDFNSKHPRAGAGSATGGQFITAGSGGGSASPEEQSQVKAIQAELGRDQTGTFTDRDTEALKAWQAKQGLIVDGKAGSQTVGRMNDSRDTDKAPGALQADDRAWLVKRSSRDTGMKARGEAPNQTRSRPAHLSATGRSVDLAARTDLLRRAAVAHRAGRLSAKQQQMVKTYLNRIRKTKG